MAEAPASNGTAPSRARFIAPGLGPFVGRDRELEVLAHRLDVAQEGRGGVILIAGEPGIGKTRLLLQVGQRAAARNWEVLFGRAYDAEGMPPYLPFVEALGEHVRASSTEQLHTELGEGASDVSLLLPELRTRFGEPPAKRPQDPESARYRLFEGVSEFLVTIASSRSHPGLLLCLDDLHWADSATLALLQHLSRKIRAAPLVVAGAYRTVDLDRSHPLLSLLGELSREHLADIVQLAPLTRSENDRLAEAVASSRPTPAVGEALYLKTGGNPFFTEEVVRQLSAEGLDLASSGAEVVGIGVPAGVRHVIGKRLARLRPEIFEVLQAASVLADGFPFEELAGACGGQNAARPRGALALEAVEEALEAGLLRQDGDGYSFSHALVRQTVYEGTSLARRQRLHLHAAEAMERLYASNLEPHLAVLAVHYRLAGAGADHVRAIDYAERAGETAMAVFGYDEAASHWQAAVELMEQQGTTAERRAGLLCRLGELMRIAGFGNYPTAIACLEAALELYEQHGLEDEAVLTHLRLGTLFGSNAATMDIPRALQHRRAAQAVLERKPDTAQLRSLYGGLANTAYWEVRTADGLALSRRAMEMAEAQRDGSGWVSAAVHHGPHLIGSGRIQEGLALMDRAWETADGLNETFAGWMAAVWGGEPGFFLGDPQDAIRFYRREVARPRQVGAPMRRQALLGDLACACALAGELEEARGILAELRGTTYDQTPATYLQPLMALYDGEWSEAARLWAQARERNARAGNRRGQADFDYWLAQACSLLGDSARASALLEESLGIAVAGPQVVVEMRARLGLALMHAEQNQPGEAEPHLARCRELLGKGEDWRGMAGRVDLVEAAIAGAQGRLEDAERRFQQAIEIFRCYSLPWDEAEALRLWGRGCAGSGSRLVRRKAVEKFDAAIDIYRVRGAGRRWIDRVETDRRQLLQRSPSAASVPTYPEGLSAREVEVLRLLAQGKSSRQIGAELVLSVRTVERHITNVYFKTGAHGRAQATTYALSKGLA